MGYGWIIYSKDSIHNKYGNNAADWMVKSAKNKDIELEVLIAEDMDIAISQKPAFYYHSKELKTPDFVLMRGYDHMISHQIESLGIRVINNTLSMLKSKNKLISSEILVKHGIKTPKTIYTRSRDYGKLSKIFKKEPFVMKQLEGSQGEKVYLIESEEDFHRAYEETDGLFLIQEFMDSSRGKDVRVYVIGNKVVGAVLRQSNGDFRSNYALGGNASLYELTPEIEELAVKASSSLGLEFSGIDLLFDKKGFSVCEINANAGFRTLSSVSDIDIPALLFDYVHKEIYAHKD